MENVAERQPEANLIPSPPPRSQPPHVCTRENNSNDTVFFGGSQANLSAQSTPLRGPLTRSNQRCPERLKSLRSPQLTLNLNFVSSFRLSLPRLFGCLLLPHPSSLKYATPLTLCRTNEPRGRVWRSSSSPRSQIRRKYPLQRSPRSVGPILPRSPPFPA